MTDAWDGKRDFFISFTGADRRWACWLACTLAEAGYRFWFQDQDFAGSIPCNIEKAHEQSNRTILLLSDAYAESGYCRSEWEMRYQEDPSGEQDLLIVFRVGPATPPPLLRRIAYVDLFDSRDEATGRERVINRLRQAIEPGAKLPLGEIVFPGIKAPFPVASHNLPPPNPDFVGREDVLAQLHELLNQGQQPAMLSQAITGLGGIGKTQTALAYAYRHLAEYALVWWLRAESPAVLAADFTTLADPLGLDSAAADQAKLIAQIRAALQASAGWLLVFDNVEDPQLPRAFLPTTGEGHVLITSRRTDWQGIAKARELEMMKESEALQLLTGRPDPDTLPISDLAEATSLAQELGYLPLALAQARAYMA